MSRKSIGDTPMTDAERQAAAALLVPPACRSFTRAKPLSTAAAPSVGGTPQPS